MHIQTVLGPIEPNKLGQTLTHEHLSIDFTHFYKAPPEHLTEYFNKGKIQLENSGFFRQYPFGAKYNLNLYDDQSHEKVYDDLVLYKKWGGSSIVENTSHGLQRNLEYLYDVSKRTGVNIIAGTGHYVAALQDTKTMKMSLEQLSDLYSKEIITGVDLNGDGKQMVKCGFIGEVGSDWPIHDFEKKALRATGEVQEVLGCGVSLHPGRNPKAPFEIIRLYLEAGGKAEKCVMSHVERTLYDNEQIFELAALGVYCQFDLFGMECSYYQLNPDTYMPSDEQRIDKICALIQEGYCNRILMSHDIYMKNRLIGYGGHGYYHIFNNILPRLYGKGLTAEQIDKLTITNPTEWLQLNV